MFLRNVGRSPNYTLLNREEGTLHIVACVFTRLFMRTLLSFDRQANENIRMQLQFVTPELGGLCKVMTNTVNMTMCLQNFYQQII
jgi:hypothetical protein